MKFSLRNNILIVLSFLVYVVTVCLLGYLMDKQLYATEKENIIIDQYFQKTPLFSAEFLTRFPSYYMKVLDAESYTEKERKDKKEDLDKMLRTIQSLADAETEKKDSPLYGMTLSRNAKELLETVIFAFVDKELSAPNSPLIAFEMQRDGEVVLSRKRKNAPALNTFRNSLIIRNYRGIGRMKMTKVNSDDEMRFTYTTPSNFPPIEALTKRYWRYLGCMFFGMTFFYVLTLRFVILPIRNVAVAIQESKGRTPKFVARPRAGLEKLYNRMARDASLTALRIGLQNPGSRRLRMTLEELLEYLEPRITEWFGFEKIWLLELEWTGPDHLTPLRQLPAASGGDTTAWDGISPVFDKALARDLKTSWESHTPRIFRRELPGDKGFVFLGAAPTPETDGNLQLLVLKVGKGSRLTPSWFKSIAEGLYEQVIMLVEQQGADSRELMREKSESNISLSRNLGHDLTNIIATNRLELMTVNQILKGEPETWSDTPEKSEILRESMSRLLDNARSLQQIVNLYRAYEYLKSPQYEPTDLNRLIGEIIDVFQLSMSVPAEISCDLTEGLPELTIEPRLIKLAIFNLLVNAYDAIRRLPPSEQSRGKIIVQTRRNHDKKRVTVKVSDRGPGIRTPQGNLAGEDEIMRIFDLGYTTKQDGGGEGLGLNWVRAILTEFHKGELTARNRPEGGAEFIFSLELESGEDKGRKPSESQGGAEEN